jgi:diacylglycerol kinase (ATP)
VRNRHLGTGEPGFHPVRKLRTILSGLRLAVVHDFAVAWKVVVSAAMLLAAAVLQAWSDLLLILFATAFVLACELLNSAVEALCDFVEPRHDARIGAIKDIAAAAVGIAMFVWLVVLAVELARLARVVD